MCQDGLNLKTNRLPLTAAREMDVGLDRAGDGGMDWKEGRIEGIREGAAWNKRAKVVIKRQ